MAALDRTEAAGDHPAPAAGATILRMAASATIKVEFDRELLERLRRRHPDKGDRELLESAARIQLGHEASARVKQRFAGVPSEEIDREAAKAVREVREEMAAERRAGN